MCFVAAPRDVYRCMVRLFQQIQWLVFSKSPISHFDYSPSRVPLGSADPPRNSKKKYAFVPTLLMTVRRKFPN
ncbi:uncharacterized protein BCR38DRAFT_450374 [Pseudomassariella vexata]|uniref:Uncharacterized protein n=1 Tax=Pseudomassariella vexata TaxID=1141098 RepID=A0A1Y2DCE2_9PEZI|nr:uncharacterized protein BCR38DRAFT_450374 [Pseudomassariella vexata]ORY56928.1 hypothetical protein BCR38DRAFT_450374 [Pseudomassariella vexata]